ncbi:KHDC3-like protein [Onychomys torridus]|uniref:KHDC3-like protein n=1 Tax=Onychomys torridus TaxID=38674 RepID=UPI00167FCA9F|nr:KHDC3-like protein [Onychomys torridus]
MAAFKSFKSLVQLQHKEGTLFQVVGDSSKLPKWFHTEHLDDPKTMYVDAWLVEMMFGKDGEYIPHVECVTRTLLHVNQWNSEEEAEILIFGPPDYQKDVSQMISNLVDYFSKKVIQEEDCSQTETQCLPVEVQEAAPELTLVEVHDAATQLSPVEVHEAATQLSPVEVHEAATQLSPVEVREAATQLAPVEVREAATQLAPVEVREAATQLTLVEDAHSTQLAPVEDGDAATQLAPVEDGDAATQLAPVEDCDAATQLDPVTVHEDASEAANTHT